MKTRKFILAVPMVLAATLIVVLMGLVNSTAVVAATEKIQGGPPLGGIQITIVNTTTREVDINGWWSGSYEEGTYLFVPGEDPELLTGTNGSFFRPHFFPGPGIYTVTLTVNGPGGFLFLQDSVEFIEDPKCGLGNTVPQHGENHVEFAADWWSGSPIGEYEFSFGDLSPSLILTGTEGAKWFGHDFPIIEGEVHTYYVGFTVYNDVSPHEARCWNSVVIDYGDTITPTHQTYLPILFKPPTVPICSIEITEQDLNHIEFGVNWSGAGSGTHTFDFGDGAVDQQFFGPEGTGTTWHDYSYPGGNFTAKLLLDGGGTCSIPVVVNWP